MLNRENALDEIYNRISTERVALGLKGFMRSPTKPIDEELLPCIFMIEDIDEVTEIAQRDMFGYPMRR